MKTTVFEHNKTKHALRRQQQRGISDKTLNLLKIYGHRVYDHHGGCRLIFNKQAKARIHSALGKGAAQIKFSAYAVVDASIPTFITVGHLTQRVWVG